MYMSLTVVLLVFFQVKQYSSKLVGCCQFLAKSPEHN